MKIDVELSDDFVELLIAASMKDRITSFKKDKKTAIFSMEPDEEKAERKRYIEAFTLVHNWYVPQDLHIKTKG